MQARSGMVKRWSSGYCAGGDKGSQSWNIKHAKALAANLEEIYLAVAPGAHVVVLLDQAGSDFDALYGQGFTNLIATFAHLWYFPWNHKSMELCLRTRHSVPAKPKCPFKHLQVRLSRADALRFKHAAELRDMTLQQGLVHAINLALKEWDEEEIADPGPRRRDP